ncbi:MAG: hypothetical protein C0594_11015 [Marinilabiliales bacterium]|nr:MAG: hypothetical protein C0594_11015 [Marinilabiliales bacterium]
MEKRKIIITGATGSLGAYLVRFFSRKGYYVIASGRQENPPENLYNYAKEYVVADITKKYTLPEADICIHTAALSDDKAKLSDLMEANVKGTLNTIEAASSVRTFVHVSSSSVYLPDEKEVKEEATDTVNYNKLSPYGKSKLESERALIEKQNFRQCFILRARNLYGHGDKVILPRLLKLVKDDTLSCPGPLTNWISMTHYENFSVAVEACFLSDLNGLKVYNVADQNPYQLISVYRNLTKALFKRQLAEKKIPIALLKFMAVFKLGGITHLLIKAFTKSLVLDLSKIQHDLNYAPEIDYDSSLPEMAAWVDRCGGPDELRKGSKEFAWIE